MILRTILKTVILHAHKQTGLKTMLRILIVSIFSVALIAAAIEFTHTKTNNKKGSTTNIFSSQAQSVCFMLDKADKLYKSKKYKRAFTVAEASYWDNYDNFLEIKYRPYATPAEIFSVENEFHDLSDKIDKEKEKTQNIHIMAEKLCREIKNQAKILAKNS